MPPLPWRFSTVPASRKKSSALGDAGDILAGPAVPTRTPALKQKTKASTATVQSKQRDTGNDGKMQTIYLRAHDIERANELEYKVKKSRTIPGRIGLSLMVRAGLKLLADEFRKSESSALELVESVAKGDE